MIKRLKRLFPVLVLRRFGAAQGSRWAVLIAWNALFAMFPIMLVSITVLGAVLRNDGIRATIEQHLVAAAGSDTGRTLVSALESFKENAGILAAVSFAGLLWAGSGLFTTIDEALDALQPCRPRGFIRQRLMAFGMVLLFTVLVTPVLFSSSALAAIQSIPDLPTVLTSGVAAILIQIGFGLLASTLLFGAIYYVVPNRRMRAREALPGAIMAAVLFEALTLVFPLYFRLAHGFALYGQTFALFFLLMTVMNLFGLILVLGGAVNAQLHPQPDPAVTEEEARAQLGGGQARPERAPQGDAWHLQGHRANLGRPAGSGRRA